jgi:DHA2 family multidrug resistance protein-like MFS transporter
MTGADRRRWWALAALAVSVLVVGLDLFVLNLALPTISGQLHASSGDLQWFVDAYSLVLAAALLPAGLLGDRLGRKRLLTIALALFGLASLACAYSTSSGELIAARATLGLAAAVILPLSLAVIPVLFTAGERPRAIAAVGGATFIGYPLGPILGGWLLDHFWWGSVFLINVPVVVIAMIAVTTLMPESRSDHRTLRVDLTGVLASSAGLCALTYGLINAGQDGWSNPTAVATMSAGVAALAVFVAWERRVSQRRSAWAAPEAAAPAELSAPGRRQQDTAARPASQALPLVDLALFRSRGFTWGTVLSTLVSFALFGLVFAAPQYFLDVRGFNSLGAGLRLLPMIGGLAIGLAAGQRLQTPRKPARELGCTPAANSLVDSAETAGAETAGAGATAGAPPVSAKIVIAAGFAIMAVALAAGASTSISSGTGFAAAWFSVTGLGLGLAMPTALNAALGALSPERSGSGSALITAMRQVGGTIGVAVLGTVLASVYRSHLQLTALSAAAAAAARSNVARGVAVAHAAGSAPLLESVRSAYVHGMDTMLWICAGIAVVSALLGLAFLPNRPAGPDLAHPDDQLPGAQAGQPETAFARAARPKPDGQRCAGGRSAGGELPA